LRKELTISADKVDELPFSAHIFAIGALLRRSGDESYKAALSLTATEWPMVVTIAHGPTSLAKLCERLKRDKGQVSRDIALLVRRGVLVKKRDPHDSRKIIIDINRKDQKLVSEIRRVTRQRDQLLMAGISDSERRQLVRLLARIENNARDPRLSEV
jgi:DNA-binding MarR family transcriptional regulator